MATVAIIWLICLWLAPKFLSNANNLVSKKSFPILGYGILTPIITLIAFVILLLLGITSTVAILALAMLFLAFAISPSVFVIALNQFICNKLKIKKSPAIFGILILLSIVVWGITLIPYVGFIISLLIFIYGLGIMVYSIIPKKEKSK